MLVMNPLFTVVVLFLAALIALVVWLVWRQGRSDKTGKWHVTEGTIQSVNSEIIYQGRSSMEVPVCDFSYQVNGEYYSGRLSVSGFTAPDDPHIRKLIDRKIEVRYSPTNPKKFLVPSVDLDGLSVGKYYELLFASDTQPTSLNID